MFVAVVAALVAGCSEPAAFSEPDAPSAPPRRVWAPYSISSEHAFLVDAAVGDQNDVLPADVNLVAPQNGVFADLPNGTASLSVGVEWTCASPTCSFRLILITPDGEVATTDAGDGSASVTQHGPVPGRWEAVMRPQGAVVEAAGTFNVTVAFAGSR